VRRVKNVWYEIGKRVARHYARVHIIQRYTLLIDQKNNDYCIITIARLVAADLTVTFFFVGKCRCGLRRSLILFCAPRQKSFKSSTFRNGRF